MGWPLVLVDWGAKEVQPCMSPGTGLRWEWGFMGSQGVHSGDPGVPFPGGFYRSCELDVVGVLGTDARIGLSEWGGLGLSVMGLVGSIGGVGGGPQGNGP